MNDTTRKVFISYSWEVQKRVIELAERLIANGVDVLIDVYNLKEGQDKYAFMEQSVNDLSVDRVLIICDKTYAEKANSRSGGVGDETVIISPAIYGQVKQEKFIPVIFEVNEDGKAYCPSYIESRIYIDLSSDDQYENEYEKLLRNIYEKPLYKKPVLGPKPEWLENEDVNLSAIRDSIKQIRGYTGGNQAKVDYLNRKATDEFVEAAKQYIYPEDKSEDEGLLLVIDKLKVYRNLFVDYCEALLNSSLSVSKILASLIERLFNELHDAKGSKSYHDTSFELYDFLIWELFISVTAIMLYYEKYSELHNLLTHTYFIKKTYFTNEDIQASNFSIFESYLRTIEEVCKPKCSEPRLFTLSGKILVEREKKPILTQESISNADLVLYQLYPMLKLTTYGKTRWFPTTYVYHRSPQLIWQKMKSKAHCVKVAPLFGVTTVNELKDLIASSKLGREMRYEVDFECAQGILDSVKLEDIGVFN